MSRRVRPRKLGNGMVRLDGLTTTQRETRSPGAAPSGVRMWLAVVAAMIFLMVMVGGATRVTESGLSITQWQPVTGVLPPLSEAAWTKQFERYRQIPQYAAINAGMTLEGFKKIYFWEWTHRLLARVVGAAFVLPALWFWRRGGFKGPLVRPIAVATCLLALEPIVGWWMVSSGLSDRIEVAQDRLALHLLIAAATFGALIYAAVSLSDRPRERVGVRFSAAAGGLVALIFCQLGLGALVAGLRAGLIDNTWPLMEGRLIPTDIFSLTPWPHSLIDDPATAQFDHRVVAYTVVAAAFAYAFAAWRNAPGSSLARRAGALAGLALLQAGLGVVTLITLAPIEFALAHQAVALALFGMAVANWRVTGMAR
jgi:cytochrome c oxidase assembly protein subunit 15